MISPEFNLLFTKQGLATAEQFSAKSFHKIFTLGHVDLFYLEE